MEKSPSQIKSSESPKTPGGISKSLLTPCRRVGLSRNWRSKGTVSPFISPLGSSNITDEPQSESRKRKNGSIEDRVKYCDSNTTEKQIKEDEQNKQLILSCNTPTSTIHRTPSRSLILRKKSKTLLLSQENEMQNDSEQAEMNSFICKYDSEENNTTSKELLKVNPVQTATKVSKPLRLNTKNKTLNKSETTDVLGLQTQNLENKTLKITNNSNNLKQIKVSNNNVNENKEEKSPNNLTKECIDVIQKNIFKSGSPNANTEKASKERSPVQTICESDNDDIPLCNVGSKENIKKVMNLNNIADLVESKKSAKKINKTTSVTDLKTKTKIKENKSNKKTKFHCNKTPSQSSNSFDDDDDFQIDNRTILIKKSYSKLVKPTKAKSTGSISQGDIDELRARIETKKNLLMAKAMSNETEELRGLIKRWQHGCQTALTELLELMKREMPGQTMDYSEILKMLKIPPDLVGYDSENDCFNTPDDKNILLSGFNLNKI